MKAFFVAEQFAAALPYDAYVKTGTDEQQRRWQQVYAAAQLTSEQSKLVFHRYGDRYFLAQIWMAGSNSGQELPKSPRETEAARDYTVQEVVLVAALR